MSEIVQLFTNPTGIPIQQQAQAGVQMLFVRSMITRGYPRRHGGLLRPM